MSRRAIAILLILLTASQVAADVSLDVLWSGGARFQVEPVRIAEDVQYMHFISMFWDDVPGDPHFKAYYIGNGYSTGLAKSYDGVRFTDQGTVLETGSPGSFDDRMAAFASVMKDEAGVYHMVYEAAGTSGGYPGDVAYATSSDGLNFTKHGIILPHDTSPNSFERKNNGTPSLHKQDDTFFLYYHGYDGDDCQIGLATGTDMTALTRVSNDPIIPTSPIGWDSGTMGKRSRPIKQGDYWYMAVEGSTNPPYHTAKWSTGVVRSPDLVNWEKCPLGNVLPQTRGGMSFDGSDMIQIGGDTYIYYRGPDNQTYRAKLVAGSEDTCGVVLSNSDISPGLRYVYELGTAAMDDSSRFDADAAAASGIRLTAVGQGDPAPHFYAAPDEMDSYLEFRFDFSNTNFRATRATIRDTLALFRIIDSPQETTAVTQWSSDGISWQTIRELQTPAWPGHAVGDTSQGTTDCDLAGPYGLCEKLYYRVYFKGEVPFGWNWNQWNRDGDNQFRVDCEVVPDDYASTSSDLLLGEYHGSTTLSPDPYSGYAWANENLGHIDVAIDDPDQPVSLLLDLSGSQDQITSLIAKMLSHPRGSEYLWSSDSHPLLAERGYDLLLQFPKSPNPNFNFTWHFAGHPEVRLRRIQVVPEPSGWGLWAMGFGLWALNLRRFTKRNCGR